MSNDSRNARQSYSDEELLRGIRTFAQEHGRPPSYNEYNDWATPRSRTLINRFGSYNNAVEAAGYEPRPPNHNGQDHEWELWEILSQLRNFGEGDQLKTTEFYDAEGTPSQSTIHRRFDSWTEACHAVGRHPILHQYTEEECLDWIKTFVLEFGFVPTGPDITGWPGPSQSQLRNKFGSFTNAVREAGYTPRGDND